MVGSKDYQVRSLWKDRHAMRHERKVLLRQVSPVGLPATISSAEARYGSSSPRNALKPGLA